VENGFAAKGFTSSSTGRAIAKGVGYSPNWATHAARSNWYDPQSVAHLSQLLHPLLDRLDPLPGRL